MNQPKTRLIPLADWPHFHPWPNVRALRNLVFKGDQNGFSSCVKRVGRRVLIDEAAFFLWVQQQQEKGYRDERLPK